MKVVKGIRKEVDITAAVQFLTEIHAGAVRSPQWHFADVQPRKLYGLKEHCYCYLEKANCYLERSHTDISMGNILFMYIHFIMLTALLMLSLVQEVDQRFSTFCILCQFFFSEAQTYEKQSSGNSYYWENIAVQFPD